MTTTRNDVKQLAQTIENLAKDVQAKLDNNGDFLAASNQLVHNTVTLVFTLGEHYASQKAGTTVKTAKSVNATPVSNPNGTTLSTRYHNVRDKSGRFAPKAV